MDVFLGAIGGLALFLYGMYGLSHGLEEVAGAKMRQALSTLTQNRLMGIAAGAGVTAAVQSSSATTVMVVGFVNAGLMSVEQSVWVIMGANIGTTITGQLIALRIGVLAPLIAIIGVFMLVFCKNEKITVIGKITVGVGLLFMGMNLMSSSLVPLSQKPNVTAFLSSRNNPLFGIAIGTILAAIIQSSSASIGLLQALLSAGTISVQNAAYVLFGQNIGTCVTALLSATGLSVAAKRTAIIHLLFNVSGTIIFTLICLFTDFINWLTQLTPGNPALQIANLHVAFNVTTTVLLLPFGKTLANLAKKIIKEKNKQEF